MSSDHNVSQPGLQGRSDDHGVVDREAVALGEFEAGLVSFYGEGMDDEQLA